MIELGQINKNKVRRIENDTKEECQICPKSKMSRKKFSKKKLSQATNVGDAIHSDLCGPLPSSLGNNSYFVTYIDEKSDYLIVKLLKEKSDNFEALKKVREEIKTQAGVRMKRLISDGGGEYIG